MKRSELHALVWSEPINTLAPHLGMTGTGLAKLCRRHAIPIPARGYWQRRDAGQPVHPSPLPEQAEDEVIPRFRHLDATGAPRADGWLVPGVLRLPGHAPEDDAEPEQQPECTPAAPPPAELPAPPPAARPEKRQPSATADAPAGKPVADADPFATNAARRALYEQALAMAARQGQHQAMATMLVTLEQLAPHLPPEEAAVLSAWAKAVRVEMGRQDPVAKVVAELVTAAASSARPAWWPAR